MVYKSQKRKQSKFLLYLCNVCSCHILMPVDSKFVADYHCTTEGVVNDMTEQCAYLKDWFVQNRPDTEPNNLIKA